MNREELADLAHVSTRMVLDATSYSNALPLWSDVDVIDYEKRSAALVERVDAILDGRAEPQPATSIAVPRKNGKMKTWILPSVNDQILLQMCALASAEVVRPTARAEQIFSYRRSQDPNHLRFTQNQLAAWNAFNAEAAERAKGRNVLQLDLKEAFRSIDLDRFFKWLARHSTGKHVEVALLQRLLSKLAPPGDGIPSIDESVFYLGNAYLDVVDEVIARHASDFIRFVDDYRIFDRSREKLEQAYGRISADLAHIGFQVNQEKVHLGDYDEFTQSLAKVRSVQTEPVGNYTSSVFLEDVLEPKALAGMVAGAVGKWESSLNEGFGRYLMQAVRRMRFNADFASTRGEHSPLDDYTTTLKDSLDAKTFEKTLGGLLTAYTTTNDWRIIWLLYVVEDLDMRDTITKAFSGQKPEMRSPVLDCWVARARGKKAAKPAAPEVWHQLSYEQAGRLLHPAL